MPTLLIRCSLHDRLPEDQFRDWVAGRRRDLVLESPIDDVAAAPLDEAAWVVAVEVAAAAAAESAAAVAGLIGDLRLLGLQPVVFRPDAGAASAPGAPSALARNPA